MDRSPSPPLPPDPTVRPRASTAAPSPPLPPQTQAMPPPVDVRPSNSSRSRANSRPAPILHQPTPVRDAVHEAFDQSPVVQNRFDPEILQKMTEQVTANVIKHLQTANLGGVTPVAALSPQQTTYAPPPTAQSITRSPTLSSTDSIRLEQYTPPSPRSPAKVTKETERVHRSPSPDMMSSDASSSYSRGSNGARSRTRDSRTPIPEQDGRDHSRKIHTSSSRRRGPGSDGDRSPRRDSKTEPSPTYDSRPDRRSSKGSDSDNGPPSWGRARPARVPSDVPETTTLEKAWQPLFEDGIPTDRLRQFLRGIALHLIDEYEPKRSLVVTPGKMRRFFYEAKADVEVYPWDVIFGSRISHNSLSTIYRRLRCQHHLVQDEAHEAPSVPGLTPNGFACFMIHLIQAHPENEFERLASAVMNMPISNADDPTERFPKNLSRRLLPSRGNMQAEQRIVASMADEPLLSHLRSSVPMPPPPPPPASVRTKRPSFSERDRPPFGQAAHSSVIDDDDLAAPSVPLERKRKPYTAKEGSGKVHHPDYDGPEPRPPTAQYKPFEVQPPTNMRSARSSNTIPTQASHNSTNGTEAIGIPKPRSHRQSMGHGPPPAMLNNLHSPLTGSLPKGRRTPPPRSPYVRSEPMDINNIPQSQYSSNVYPSSGSTDTRDHYVDDLDDDNSRQNYGRRSSERYAGASNDDDSNGVRGYPIPPRPPPSTQAYADGAGGPPIGSYPRQTSMSSADRRRTWYGPNNSSGGSDGYGSFANGSGYSYGASGQH